MARLCFGTNIFGAASFVITRMNQTLNKQDQSTDHNSRQPMDGDAILEGFEATGFSGESFRLRCFNLGVRWAEEYHGIGGKDE